MKKIISAFLAIVMIAAALSITASAASEKPKAAYRVNWSELSYTSYWYNEKKNDMSSNFTVTKTANSITSTAKSGCERRAYYSKEMYEITSDTKYEYVFQAKNNRDYGYCGVIFAHANNLAYFMYGSFNNISDDPNDGKSDIRVVKGLNQHDSKSCGTGYTRSYITADIDSDGYGTFKVVINGFTASFYALTDAANGTFTPVGNSITLPDGAKVALGVFNREGSGSSQRTVSVRNAVLYAMNDAAAQNISSVSDGSYELLSYIDEVLKNYPEVDYEASSYKAILDIAKEAETAVSNGSITKARATELKSELDSALIALELKEADIAALEEAIEKAEAIDETKYTVVSYKMLLNAIDNANELLGDPEVRQSEIDAAVALINTRCKDLIPLDGVIPEEDDEIDDGGEDNSGEDNSGEEDSDSNMDSCIDELPSDTGTPADTSSETLPILPKPGCKSSVAVSALAAVAIIGTALVLKKKED